MWSTRKRNSPQLVPSKPRNLPNGSKSSDALPVPRRAANRSTGWLGPSVHLKGDIIGTDDLLIDGSVEGIIQLNQKRLTVGKEAKLKADIDAGEVIVSGHVKGNVRATARIEIKKEGSVIGNLMTAEIMIENGAEFKGTIEIDRSASNNSDRNVSSLAVSPGPEGTKTNSSSQDAWTN